jgi:anti-sigma28 factor (negative regulator of flagellin synthesis)
MKIEGNCQNPDATPAGKVDAARIADVKAGKASKAAGAPSASGADQFVVSPDAKLANTAVDAAEKSSDIRPEAVARAKALLADGKIGNDPHRLADALIDSILKNG